MSKLDLSAIRKDYSQRELSPEECRADPMLQLQDWLEAALHSQVNEPTAMNIATVGADGRPSARMVLCKGIEDGCVVFFTNYESRKGQQLEQTPFAAVTFFWPELERQVRVEGRIGKLPAKDSDAYFASRPYASRLGAWASLQSQPLDAKSTLVTRAAQFGLKYVTHVPRPPHWGGYALQPDRVEFWQGRPSRLHDRVVYVLKSGENWEVQRLYP